ncbi:MAG TPA: condensation domain-containing protein, partial [Longimicrobium sp.]
MTSIPSVTDAERLLKLARAARLKRSPTMAPIEPVERGPALSLSFAQQRLWFLEQLGTAGGAYHVHTRLHLRGDLDREALVRALDRMLARHEVLRTVFAQVDGQPVQRVLPAEQCAFRLADHDLSGHPEARAEQRRLMAEETGAPFDLERGPLIRGGLIRLAPDDHVLLVTMHHIVSDEWSMGVFSRELSALYDAFRRGEPDPLPALPIQYADYAAWQRRWVAGEVLAEQSEYWKRTLAGAPELLELPTDHPRPARPDYAGVSVSIDLGEELSAGVKALAQRHGTTLFMTLLAAWAVVLGRLSGQDDVVVGTPSANRQRKEVEGLIGFFVNTLAVRVDLSGSPTVARLLEQVKERALGAQYHQDIPFEQVVELVQPARTLAYTPLVQVMFSLQGGTSQNAVQLPGLTPAPVERSTRAPAKFDLSLVLEDRGGRIGGSVTYATALFEQATVKRHVGYLRRVLEAMVADDLQAVDALPLVPDDERRRVVEEWNAAGVAVPPELCIHERFEAQAARTPGAVALAWENGEVTYGELNARANRLAHHLRGLGVGPEARVAVCVERGPEMVVAMLAVLKAGGAYVPLDPAYPEERLRYMLADSRPAALLVDAALRHLFADAALSVVEMGAPRPAWAGEPETNPERGALSPAHLAYVIYTSGSTGRPKGVRVSHGSVAATLAVAGDAFGFGAGDRVPSLASFAFDIWLFETFLPLLAGGTVRLVPRERVPDVPRLVEDLAGCTALHAVPALMRRIVEEVRARP